MAARNVAWCVSLAALVVVVACASPRGSRAPVATAVTLTPQQAGQTIQLRGSQELFVRLPSNPSTGYRWTFVVAPGDVLKPAGSPALEGGNLAGAPGIEVWRFRPIGTGHQTLRFEYRRPWEPDGAPAQQLWYTVTVR
jgi:inhibitor of cysteine peptidase